MFEDACYYFTSRLSLWNRPVWFLATNLVQCTYIVNLLDVRGGK